MEIACRMPSGGHTLNEMNVISGYFRQHRWQRRILTVLAAAIVGVIAAWLALPTIRDIQIINMLGSQDPLQRQRGIALAVASAENRPQLIDRIERKLDSAGDLQFSAMVSVLNRLGKFHAPAPWGHGRKGEQLDRFYLINLIAAGAGSEDTQAGEVRQILLHRLILGGRDNAHVRKALRLSACDGSAEVRAASALAAARLGDDKTLLALLGDADPQVRAAAALDAALAGRTGCTDAIIKIFKAPQTDEERAAAAYALARLSPGKAAPLIVEAIRAGRGNVRKSLLLDKLLYAAALLDKKAAGPAVLDVLKSARRRGKIPPATALIAAGRMELHEAEPVIAWTIRRLIARKDKLTVGEATSLAAAVNAAGRLKMPPKPLVETIEKLWHPETSLAMILAAEALGEHASHLKLENLSSVLRRAADRTDTPTPAAAAAVALFKLTGKAAEEPLLTACESRAYLAGDYVTWNLACVGDAEARHIAEVFFGPGIYNKAVRANGAILLSLLAHRTGRPGDDAAAIESRLLGQQDPFLVGSYHCALLTLGRREFVEKVAALTASESFGQRRVLTALAIAGAPAGFDTVFAGAKFNPDRIDSYLTGRLMARVYAAVMPEAPPFDIDAPPHIRHWQCRILRDYYLIHRRAILGKMQS